MPRYNSRQSTEEAFTQDVGLPGSALPQGQGYILGQGGRITVPQAGGIKREFYPTTTGGQLDLFGIEVPAGQDEKGKQEEEISQRMDAYKAMSIAELHTDLANAGFVADVKGKMQEGDPMLQQLAYQEYILRTSKINAWNQSVQDKFNVIKKEEKLDQKEKQVLRNKILADADDPIYIPRIEKPAGQLSMQQSIGKVMANIEKKEYITRSDFLYGTPGKNNGIYQLFGPNALETIPGLREMADKYFPETSTEASAKTSVKQVQPAGKTVTVSTREEYDKLKSGTHYMDSKGNVGVKP